MKLTEKMKRFCDYYIETGNQSEAARLAGYSEKTANRMGAENMTKPVIKAYIAEKMGKKDKSRIASQDEILELLTSIARGEIEERVMIGIGGGAQEFEMNTPQLKDRKAAAELLGKRYGMWTEKLDITGTMVKIVDDLKED